MALYRKLERSLTDCSLVKRTFLYFFFFYFQYLIPTLLSILSIFLICLWLISLNAFLGGKHPQKTGWSESVKRQNASGTPFIYILMRLTCLFNQKWTIFPHTALSVTDIGLQCSCQYGSDKKSRKHNPLSQKHVEGEMSQGLSFYYSLLPLKILQRTAER